MLYSFKTVSGESLCLNLDCLLAAYPANPESTVTRVLPVFYDDKVCPYSTIDLDITYSNFLFLLGVK